MSDVDYHRQYNGGYYCLKCPRLVGPSRDPSCRVPVPGPDWTGTKELTFTEAMGEVVNGGKVDFRGDLTRDCWVEFEWRSHDTMEVTPRMLYDLNRYTHWRRRP